MIFTSPSFLFLFLPAAVLCFAVTPNHLKKYALLALNVLFYIYLNIKEPIVTLLLFVCLLYTFVAGKLIRLSGKRSVLAFFVLLELVSFFVYRIFLVKIPSGGEYHFFPSASFLLLSSVSYMFDVHRKDADARLSFLDMASYISFFPVILAGPVVKYKSFVMMLDKRSFGIENFSSGVVKFCLGFVKKVVVAATFTETLTNLSLVHSEDLTLYSLAFGIIISFFKILFEVWGYCDMAEGISLMLGYRLNESFNNPLASQSVLDFFSRFYLGLKEWITDYVYRPISKITNGAWFLSLMASFLFGALWIKTDVYMLVLGLLLGLLVFMEKLLLKHTRRRAKFPFNVFASFLTVVFMALVFFAVSFDFDEFLGMIRNADLSSTEFYSHFVYLSVINLKFVFVSLTALAFLLFPAVQKKLLASQRENYVFAFKLIHNIVLIVVFVFALLYFLPQFPEYFSVVFDFISL